MSTNVSILSPQKSNSSDAEKGTRASWTGTMWAVTAAFGAYFCMYGFRKPFTAASYSELQVWGVGYKSFIVTAQVFGYMISKFIGIVVISGIRPERRVRTVLLLVGVAEVMLLLYAATPAPWNIGFLFLNGLPLGMVFGLVLGFLEGRRMTEALTAGLCASFILADGVSKSVGAWLLAQGVDQFWMPFTAGALFTPPLLLFSWMLTRIPPPTAVDIAMRRERPPLIAAERRRILRRYLGGLTMLCGAYLLLTILRSVRADFAPEIWAGLGYHGQPALFTRSELLVTVGVILANGLAVLIRDNRRAFFTALGTALAGFGLAGLGLGGWQQGWIDGFPLMVLLGLGLYLPYVAMHTTIFERLIAMTDDRANLGYLMYLADSFGYLGYVAVMLARETLPAAGNFNQFFVTLTGGLLLTASLLVVGSWFYFSRQARQLRSNQEPA
jgi:hypothetical protein